MAGAPPAEQREYPTHLTHVGSYRRHMPVSLTRMYENALDWEHLPWLHRSSFSSIACLDAGDWGWRARAGLAPESGGGEIRLELLLDEPRGRWISRVLEGATAGGEIWTYATELAPHEIVIEVDFYYPNVSDPDVARMLGATMEQLYATLYDEDEWMMVEREQAVRRVAGPRPRAGTALDLGPRDALLPRLPLQVELDERPYRVVQLGDELVAHATTCPHLLGPLNDAAVEDGCVRCPWHGYQFDIRTGACTNQDGYRLPRAPRITVDPATSHVTLAWGEGLSHNAK